MDARYRLALRLLVRAERAWRLTRRHRGIRALRAGADMQTLERIDARLQRRRQRPIRGGTVGEQRLTLAARHRLHREEQRDVGWWAAVTLIGVPTAAMWELHGQESVGGQRRIGAARRGPRGRWR